MGALEAEVIRLRGSLEAANQEVTQLKNSKAVLNEKYEALFRKRAELEAYLGDITKKWYLVLEGMPPLAWLKLDRSTHILSVDSTCCFRCRVLS